MSGISNQLFDCYSNYKFCKLVFNSVKNSIKVLDVFTCYISLDYVQFHSQCVKFASR